jgi:hypothetical protein
MLGITFGIILRNLFGIGLRIGLGLMYNVKEDLIHEARESSGWASFQKVDDHARHLLRKEIYHRVLMYSFENILFPLKHVNDRGG